jgi:hypothetical protein
MPRGNDSAAALADLRGEFAGAGGTAEDLISANRAAYPESLRTAQNIPRDEEYDEALGKDRLVKVDLEKVQSVIGDDGVVLAAAKRGPYVVAVVEGESGRTYKTALAASDVGFDKAPERASLPDPEAEDDSPERASLMERMKLTAEAKQIEKEAEEAAAEARQKVYDAAAKNSEDSSSSGDSGSGSGKAAATRSKSSG